MIDGYKPYHQQKSVLRVRKGIVLPTPKKRVVECVAEATVAFLRQAAPTDDHDGTFSFGPTGLRLRDLFLLDLERHGMTLIPVLGYILPQALATPPQQIQWTGAVEGYEATFQIPSFFPEADASSAFIPAEGLQGAWNGDVNMVF
ncbi:hypothetical protein PsYK624_089430 [Phanerochaete sordida]|uniref:Uncharacterized protein n=1 Tax=Phanerochaete sordida TaxID=48140 RepID=A0A9P3LER1_9APHY|nr:hypothetical protein PsYK624_089430 [Phanerochaete sordida]